MHVYTVVNDAKHIRKIQRRTDCNKVTGLLFSSITFLLYYCFTIRELCLNLEDTSEYFC